jgi:hypothetical protein
MLTVAVAMRASLMTSLLVGGLTSPLEAYFNSNLKLRMWIRPTIPANSPNIHAVLLQTGICPQSNQISMSDRGL